MSHTERPEGRVIALDIGEVRTGVAISDPSGLISRPLEVVESASLSGYLRALIEEQAVREVVVGIPKTLSGEMGFQARRVLDRLDTLRGEFPGVRFVRWDERFTTQAAERGLREARGSGRKRGRRGKERLDHLAAARMLQEYLEAKERA